MGKTYRTSKLAAAGILPEGRVVKESALRRARRAAKKLFHHRDRRAATRWIAGQLQEAI